MKNIDDLSWGEIYASLDENGFAIAPGIMTQQECKSIIHLYDDNRLYRNAVSMQQYRFGKGEYKYFSYPLPQLIQQLRETVYPKLVPIVNNWMHALNIATRFPATLDEQLALCHANNQVKPTALILKYAKGGFNALHQDLYGDIFFPVQMVIFLNEPGRDFEGGEFVLIEQKPRAQSKAIVLNPRKGDILVFTTNYRPVNGTRGYHRVNMKHGVSEIIEGKRHTLGIIFHDAG